MKGSNICARTGGGYNYLENFIKSQEDSMRERIQATMDAERLTYKMYIRKVLMRHLKNQAVVDQHMKKNNWLIEKQSEFYVEPKEAFQKSSIFSGAKEGMALFERTEKINMYSS